MRKNQASKALKLFSGFCSSIVKQEVADRKDTVSYRANELQAVEARMNKFIANSDKFKRDIKIFWKNVNKKSSKNSWFLSSTKYTTLLRKLLFPYRNGILNEESYEANLEALKQSVKYNKSLLLSSKRELAKLRKQARDIKKGDVLVGQVKDLLAAAKNLNVTDFNMNNKRFVFTIQLNDVFRELSERYRNGYVFSYGLEVHVDIDGIMKLKFSKASEKKLKKLGKTYSMKTHPHAGSAYWQNLYAPCHGTFSFRPFIVSRSLSALLANIHDYLTSYNPSDIRGQSESLEFFITKFPDSFFKAPTIKKMVEPSENKAELVKWLKK